MMLANLDGNDLKNCRLVCKAFDRVASTYLDEKTCLVFDGSVGFTKMGFTKHKAKRLVRYLTEADVKLSPWSNMRVRNVSEGYIRALLRENLSHFTKAMMTVTVVEFVKSTMTWPTLIKFLSLFKNLEKYVDNANTYYNLQENALFCCQAYFDPEERTLREIFDYKMQARKISFSFVEPTWDVLMMMRILEITCSNLEEFCLSISTEKESFPFERSEFSNNLGLLLLKNLHTLKVLRIQWTAVNYHFFFEDFFRVIPVLMTSRKEIMISELVLDFDWIFLGHSSFEIDLIPFVKRLRHLKKFTLTKVILQAGLGHLIEEIRPPSGCEFNLGVLLSDHPTIEEAMINREVLKTEVFTSSTTTMRLAIDLTTTSNVGQLIPLGAQSCLYLDDQVLYNGGCVNYPKVTELMIKHIWNGPNSSFMSYNIYGVVSSFPNLTELCIFDGPKFEYIGSFRIRHQWDFMSEATLVDFDLQLIIKNLTKLKIIRIRANLEPLTDCALTGLTSKKKDVLSTIVSHPGHKPNRNEILPDSISDLAGTIITFTTPFHYFNSGGC